MIYIIFLFNILPTIAVAAWVSCLILRKKRSVASSEEIRSALSRWLLAIRIIAITLTLFLVIFFVIFAKNTGHKEAPSSPETTAQAPSCYSFV